MALCESIFFLLCFPNCRRVRSGSGISVISSTAVDQRLPEEPVLEDEQQQLEKKLPGKAVFPFQLHHIRGFPPLRQRRG